MATITGVNLTTPRVVAKVTDYKPNTRSAYLNNPWKRSATEFRFGRLMHVRPARAAPDSISDKVAESIKKAEETCSDNAASGECVAAWDEVEELSAAASHARDKKKAEAADPLEAYCKDNPETDECRTYED